MITPQFTSRIPLSLYIHIPWCVRKCPYCDFNSHAPKAPIDEDAYVDCLLDDLDADLKAFPWVIAQPLQSIFFGGGTPSLFHAPALKRLLIGIAARLPFKSDIEITLEANPGTIEHDHFSAYHAIGINRISLGIQSFHDAHLTKLGRIHSSDHALSAITQCLNVPLRSFNCDLMHGLPDQTVEQAVSDLQNAIENKVPHISWYQLTIEPNTVFYKQRPPLPSEERLEEIEMAGIALLEKHGYQRYEISAYCLPGHHARHNQHYWQFGDYLGIGAGAHGKITDVDRNVIIRTQKTRLPKDYIENVARRSQQSIVPNDEIVFEYLLNRCRLYSVISFVEFEERTGLSRDRLLKKLDEAVVLKLVHVSDDGFELTAHGRRFMNSFLEMFLKGGV